MLSVLGISAGLVGCAGGNGTEGPEPEFRRWTEPVQVVVVDASEGSVTLNGSNTRVVDATFTATREGDNFQAGLSQGRLVIGAICQQGARGCGMNIELDLPSDVEFDIVTDSGDVTINSMGFVGSVQTISGLVRGSDLGQIELDTVATLGADQDLGFRLRPTSVSMDAGQQGNINITVPPGEYNFEINTSGSTLFESGDVSPNSNDDTLIELRSGTGDVVVGRS